MSASLPNSHEARHPVSPDDAHPLQAKVDPRNPDTVRSVDPSDEWAARLGHVIAYAVMSAGWSQKEAADRIGVDDAEFGKWCSGARRPHWDRLFAMRVLRQHLVIGLARTCDGQISTQIQFRNVL